MYTEHSHSHSHLHSYRRSGAYSPRRTAPPYSKLAPPRVTRNSLNSRGVFKMPAMNSVCKQRRTDSPRKLISFTEEPITELYCLYYL